MSDASTRHMIDMYVEQAAAPMWLSGFFQTPPRNFYASEAVEVDVIRDTEDVAIVITDLKTGARINESNIYSNKAFKPPIFDEAFAIHAWDQLKRQAGVNPFQDVDFVQAATEEAFVDFGKIERKIRRAIELMASQVLRTGKITCIDKAGTPLFELDFKPKATHFPTVATAWAEDGTTGDPLTDVENLGITVRRDGKRNPTRLAFGASAFRRFKANKKVQEQMQPFALNANLGQFAPETRGQGATFYGWVWIGNYRFEIWLYDGYYLHPQTGLLTPYIGDNEMIMMSDGARLDLSFGAVPMIMGPETRALPFMPPRISSSESGIDLATNAWVTPDGKTLMVSAASRPLPIPTALDTFGCLTVQP